MNKKTKKRKKSQIRQRNLIVNNSGNEDIENIILNQFICAECYHTNLVLENIDKKTSLYQEKNILCTTCHKHTEQICVKDKSMTKAVLETSISRSFSEEKTFRMIKKSNNRRSS